MVSSYLGIRILKTSQRWELHDFCLNGRQKLISCLNILVLENEEVKEMMNLPTPSMAKTVMNCFQPYDYLSKSWSL